MSHKLKNMSPLCEGLPADKYLNKLIRLENTQAARKGLQAKQFNDKLSHIVKSPNTIQSPKAKPRSIPRQRSPVSKVPQKEHDVFVAIKEPSKSHKVRQRSTSGARTEGRDRDRESWGQILLNNKSKEKVSSFSNFDPLRTLHFLSKELHTKLKKSLPGNEEISQMVADMQHALKRIPPEVSTFLHNPEFSEVSSCCLKNTTTKSCQTPPTLYQEDTEKFQKIMEENTYRLETSCKQLEMVCTNLQAEKEITERELDEARENIDLLCKKVKELENELEILSTIKMTQLEEEKRQLQQELDKARHHANTNPTIDHYRKLVEDLKKQKAISDESCARLEYDMTLLKMEKEKFVTMLAIRDREIKEIQDEMSKIQDQVNQQLKKLNGEVTQRANSMRAASSDPFIRNQDNLFEIGDTTMSSITSHESDTSIVKESACGDAEVAPPAKETQGNARHDLKANNLELDLPHKEKEGILDDLLLGLSPSLRCLLTSHNL